MVHSVRWFAAALLVLFVAAVFFFGWSWNRPKNDGERQLPIQASGSDAVAVAGAPDATDRTDTHDTHVLQAENAMRRISGQRRLIRFLDGEEIEVTFRSFVSSPQHQAAASANGEFAVLKQLAQSGNGAAAYEAYQLKLQCMNAPKSPEALEEAVAELFQTFSIPDATAADGKQQFGSDTDLTVIEKQMRDQHRRCSSIHEDVELDPWQYLQMAADAGTYPATLEYARHLEKEDQASAVPYFEKAWNNGDVNAAFALGKAYLEGRGEEPPDRYKAYAYTYLGAKLSAALYEGKEGEAVETIRGIVLERSQKLLSEFYPSEAEAATPLAKAILSENKRCCVY